jgi:hypothetical protein
MANRADIFHPLLNLPSTATSTTRLVPAYRDRATATWYLPDPQERICLYCALPARLRDHDVCVTPGVAHAFAPRGLATVRHALDLVQVVETRQVAQRQLQQVRPDGTIHDSWEPLP